jgi:hypothetical protein
MGHGLATMAEFEGWAARAPEKSALPARCQYGRSHVVRQLIERLTVQREPKSVDALSSCEGVATLKLLTNSTFRAPCAIVTKTLGAPESGGEPKEPEGPCS